MANCLYTEYKTTGNEKMSFKRTITFVSIFLKYLIHIHTGREGVPSETKIVGMVFGIYLWKYSMNIIHPLKSWNCAMWACWEIGDFHFSPIFTNSGYFCVFSEKEINNIVIPDICHMHHMRCRCQNFQPGVKILWIGEKSGFFVFCYQKIWNRCVFGVG